MWESIIISKFLMYFRWLWKGNWFIQEKSCKILALIVRYTFGNFFHHQFLRNQFCVCWHVLINVTIMTCFNFSHNFSARKKTDDGSFANGDASNSKKKITTIDDVLDGLVKWLCAQVCCICSIPLPFLSCREPVT